jgi:molecular chaperone GrpE (heat shock protein)
MVPAGQKKKWDKFEMDGVTGVTPHVCRKPEQERQQQQQQPLTQQQPSTNSNNNSNLSKEIAAIKAQLLGLVSRLDNIEQELQIAVK